jgi:hypothetical protein
MRIVRSRWRWCAVDQQRRLGSAQRDAVVGDQLRRLELERRWHVLGSIPQLGVAETCVVAPAFSAPVGRPHLEGRVMRAVREHVVREQNGGAKPESAPQRRQRDQIAAVDVDGVELEDGGGRGSRFARGGQTRRRGVARQTVRAGHMEALV